jgi:hypothetical protein
MQLHCCMIAQRPACSILRRKRGKLHRCTLGNKPSGHRCLRVGAIRHHHQGRVGRRCRAAQTSTSTSGAMFLRAHPHRSVSIATLLAVRLGQTGRFALPSLVVLSCAPFDTARTTNQVRQRWRERRGSNPARIIRSGARKRGRQPLLSGQTGFHGWRVKAVRRSWPQDGTVVTSRVGSGVGINPIAWHRQRIVREYWIPRN